MKEFWKLLDERLELCHKALRIGCEYLKGTKSDVAPILWQDGALARLKPGETIDKFLKGGYSTTSLGYVGLYETMMALTGKPHTDESNKEFAINLVKYLKEKCDYWNTLPDDDYGYSLYGTPEESTTYKFATALQKRHGIIKDITDKLYVINSYHWNVKDGIDAFTKISTEALFQKYTTGGAISYVETPSMINNIPAVLAVMQHIYDNIMYAELNCKLDYCQKCGYDGEIIMVEDENKKLMWKCPNCGNTDTNSMNVIRRVCGYLSNTNKMCIGRLQDIKNRALNL